MQYDPQYDPNRRLAILAQGYLGTSQAKTAEGMIRYGRNPIAAVIDEASVGKTVDEVLAFLRQLAEADRAQGDGRLARTIGREMARIEWDRLVGMTYTEAWETIQSRVPVYFPYLPIVVQ